MTEITLETLRREIDASMTPLRQELGAIRLEFRREIEQALIPLRHDIVRLEAKIDSKPGIVMMFTAILLTVFGLLGVVASSVATLNVLGFIKASGG